METVTPDTGVLFDRGTEDSLESAIREFNTRRFDAALLRRHALRFAREVYRTRMRATLAQAYAEFQRRHEDPGAVERLAAPVAKRQDAVL